MRLDGFTKGMLAGAVGVAAMTAAEKVEQRFTGRPNSYVPARTLAHLFRLGQPDSDRPVRNHVMHWGTGILVGGVRGAMAARGLRGTRASAVHTVARLSTDQTLENLTRVGSPPWTWSRDELVIDVGHKAVYSFFTGWVADRLIKPRAASATPATPSYAPTDKSVVQVDTSVDATDMQAPATVGTADVGARLQVVKTDAGATAPIDVPADTIVNTSPS